MDAEDAQERSRHAGGDSAVGGVIRSAEGEIAALEARKAKLEAGIATDCHGKWAAKLREVEAAARASDADYRRVSHESASTLYGEHAARYNPEPPDVSTLTRLSTRSPSEESVLREMADCGNRVTPLKKMLVDELDRLKHAARLPPPPPPQDGCSGEGNLGADGSAPVNQRPADGDTDSGLPNKRQKLSPGAEQQPVREKPGGQMQAVHQQGEPVVQKPAEKNASSPAQTVHNAKVPVSQNPSEKSAPSPAPAREQEAPLNQKTAEKKASSPAEENASAPAQAVHKEGELVKQKPAGKKAFSSAQAVQKEGKPAKQKPTEKKASSPAQAAVRQTGMLLNRAARLHRSIDTLDKPVASRLQTANKRLSSYRAAAALRPVEPAFLASQRLEPSWRGYRQVLDFYRGSDSFAFSFGRQLEGPQHFVDIRRNVAILSVKGKSGADEVEVFNGYAVSGEERAPGVNAAPSPLFSTVVCADGLGHSYDRRSDAEFKLLSLFAERRRAAAGEEYTAVLWSKKPLCDSCADVFLVQLPRVFPRMELTVVIGDRELAAPG
ncbi:hypothetical protein DIPPA_01759 [Diplonema papillatum]|nr:hypothetical protein DIPPA_01759 [Diplonema papillatum]